MNINMNIIINIIIVIIIIIITYQPSNSLIFTTQFKIRNFWFHIKPAE